MQKWIHIDEQYLQQLRAIEPRIPYSEYGKDKFKPFFGVLFEIEDLSYVTQVSSPKKRHFSMTNQKDFKKIYDLNTSQLLCVVNLNYMFPIPTALIEEVRYKDIDKYRSFKTEKEKSYYISLLKKELNFINRQNLEKDALYLYHLKYSKPFDTISKRCFDFKKLEIVARQLLNNMPTIEPIFHHVDIL